MHSNWCNETASEGGVAAQSNTVDPFPKVAMKHAIPGHPAARGSLERLATVDLGDGVVVVVVLVVVVVDVVVVGGLLIGGFH